MAAQVVVLLGPVRSGKTFDLARRYRAALDNNSPADLDRALWLAPNGRTAAAIRDELVRGGLNACLRSGVLTFEDLTDQVLAASGARLKPVDAILKRELLRRVISQAIAKDALKFFADAARRSGFIGLVAGHIVELKRRNIRPDAYAIATTRGPSSLEHKELAQLYADYESLLATHVLTDRESEHDAARNALAKNTCHRFQNLALIVADGFTDFTSTQHEILRMLSRRAKQLLISLPIVPDSTRPDLFTKTAATLHEFRHNFPALEVRAFDRRPLPKPSIDHLTQHIFAHPRQVPPPSPDALDSLAQIEIIAAAGVQDEIIQIARRIKALLTQTPLPSGEGPGECARQHASSRTSPNDILVVFRSLTNIASRVREVFDRFGIPCYIDATPPIVTAPAIKTLLDLVQLIEDDWPFRHVISVLTNNSIEAFTAQARRAADWLVRDLQIPLGKSALLSRAHALAEDDSLPREGSDHLQRRAEAATVALPALLQLADALHELPEQASPVQWCQALARLGISLGLSPFADSTEELNTSGHAAWRAVFTNFAALERLDTWLDQPPRQLTRAQLLVSLREVATNASLPPTHNETGRVRILSATAARNVAAKHLFLAGLSEQAFPSPEPAGRLATDADYRRLAETAHERTASTSSPAATRAQGEMLLFYEVVSRAEESLTISFPALDDKAQTLPPSPYVVEVERLFANDPVRPITRTTPQLSPVAAVDTPYCIADWRTQAIARAIETDGDRRPLAGILACAETRPLAAALDAGLRIVHSRAHGESFGPAEGLLTSPAISARLAQRFGNQHTWSASQWETYAGCPFRFFMRDVLDLEPLGDLVLETDFARRGSRLHDVLAAFHRQWLTLRRESYSSPEEEAAAFLAHLREVANDRTSSSGRVGIDAALLELDRRQILNWANRHFENQAKYEITCAKLGVSMTPAHLEFRFGPDRRGDSQADPASTTSTFVLDINGEPVQITGQIDRVDVGIMGGKTVFNVIDYKSGRRTSLQRDRLETGQQLQLPIYVEAAQALIFKNGATPLQAGYWGMGSGFDSKGALASTNVNQDSDGWQVTHSSVHRLIRKFIDNIRHGDFPVASRDDKCTSTCDFHMTCRVAQVRSLNKTWWPEPSDL